MVSATFVHSRNADKMRMMNRSISLDFMSTSCSISSFDMSQTLVSPVRCDVSNVQQTLADTKVEVDFLDRQLRQ